MPIQMSYLADLPPLGLRTQEVEARVRRALCNDPNPLADSYPFNLDGHRGCLPSPPRKGWASYYARTERGGLMMRRESGSREWI